LPTRGAELCTGRSKGGTFRIVEILVVGVKSSDGFQTVRPTAYFTLFTIEEQTV
jgi:hypothetical protein